MSVRLSTPLYTSNTNYPFPYPINCIVKSIVNFSEFVVSRPLIFQKSFDNYSLQMDDSLQISKSTPSTLEKIAQFAIWFIISLAPRMKAGIAIGVLLLPKIYNRFSLPYFTPKTYFQSESIMDEVRGKVFSRGDMVENPNTRLALYSYYLHNDLHEDAKKVLESIPTNFRWGFASFMDNAMLEQIHFYLQKDNFDEAQKITESLKGDTSKETANIVWMMYYFRHDLTKANEISDLILNNPKSTPESINNVKKQWVKYYLSKNNSDEAAKWIQTMSNKGSGLTNFTHQQMGMIQLYRYYLDKNEQVNAEETANLYSQLYVSGQPTSWGRLITFEQIKYHLANNNLEKAKSIFNTFSLYSAWRLGIQLQFVLFYIRSKNLIDGQKMLAEMDFTNGLLTLADPINPFHTPLNTECRLKMTIAAALLKK